MQSAAEREKLEQAYGEPPALGVIVMSCVLGLFALTGLAALNALDSSNARWQAVDATADVRTAEGHRKQVFDERRARYMGGEPAPSVADGRPPPLWELAAPLVH